MRSPHEMKSGPGASSAKTRTETADPAPSKEQDQGNRMPNSSPDTPSVGRLGGPAMSDEAAEDLAYRMMLDRDPLALACYRIGLESRSLPRPNRLHPEDVDLIARQVAVELQLGEQSAEVARAAQKAPQRYTGTALGDRAASGRDNDPFPTYTHDELTDLEHSRRAA